GAERLEGGARCKHRPYSPTFETAQMRLLRMRMEWFGSMRTSPSASIAVNLYKRERRGRGGGAEGAKTITVSSLPRVLGVQGHRH
ncbi:MAG TPA: hypothetical protein DCG04_00635, partial [Rhodospirillaceae bacterium]|nr:hypothetical protein [Rhodospirillaceae bacterium]